MRLVLIYNVWGDWDMLSHSIRIMKPLSDGIIIIGSTQSNHGEYAPIPEEWHINELYIREPMHHAPMYSETDKRNYGLEIAKNQGYTHFLAIDADEIYKDHEFLKAKERFLNPNLNGLVCPSVVYFGKPTLTIGRDITLVPFIHKLTPIIRHEFNRAYPHAWHKGQIRIDPTRSLNINTGVAYTDEITMHHFSHVRKDYEKKLRNSTARDNINKSPLREDYANAKPGYFSKFYQQTLKEVPDQFGIGTI